MIFHTFLIITKNIYAKSSSSGQGLEQNLQQR